MRSPRPNALLTSIAIALACAAAAPPQAPRAADGPRRDPSLVAASPSRPEIARIDSLWTAGEREAAVALMAELLAASRREGDSTAVSELLLRRGVHAVAAGAALAAEPELRRALDMAAAAGDSQVMRASVRWLSVAIGMQGRLAEASALYARLLELAQAAGDARHEAWAHVGMAWDAHQRGRLAEAIAHHRRAETLFEACGDQQGMMWVANGLGTTLTAGGDYAAAIASYERAASLADRGGFAIVEAMALNNLGDLEYALGDPGAAERRFARALWLQRAIGQVREAIVPMVNIAACRADLGRLAEAEAMLDSCLAICLAGHYRDLQGMVLRELGSLSARRGRLHRAAEHYRRALALGDAPSQQVRLRCLLGLSDALAELGRSGEALALLQDARRQPRPEPFGEWGVRLTLTRGRRLLETGRNTDAREELERARRDAARLGHDALQVEALALAAQGWLAADAQGAADSALARLELAARLWEQVRETPLDPEWREHRGAAGQMVHTDLADLLLRRPGGGPRAAFDRLQAFKSRTLLERMRGPQGTAAGGPAPPAPASLAALQDGCLRPGELLLDVHLGPRVSLLLAVTIDSCRAVRLPPQRVLEERLLLHHELVSDPQADPASLADLDAAGGALAALLLAGVTDLILASGRIVLCPDGALNLTALAALPLPRAAAVHGGAGDGDDSGYSAGGTEGGNAGGLPERLVDRGAWSRVPSAGVLLAVRARQQRSAPADGPRVLAIAGGAAGETGSLPGALREARGLGRRYRGVEVRLLDDGRALEPAALRNLGGYDILHLAAHLELDDQHPWRSELRLGQPGEGGALRAGDIAALDLPARLAVLSSCSSGGGRILSGEGVLGMTSAFLSAGVPAVAATLWPVDDEATADFMQRFYAELAGGRSAAGALRAAQRALRDDPATAHPFFWAGFVMVGDGDVVLSLAPRPRFRPPGPVAVAAVVAAAVAAGLLVARRRSRGRCC